MIHRLDNPIRPYDWGSRTAIAALLGRPSSGPEAELWMGAHPDDPSLLPDGRSLDARIAADPVGELGAAVVAELGPELPFLAKVLAAERPLSLQTHPTAAQARAGFDAEEAAGIARGASARNYRDRNHKPELICALTPFTGLVGFRPVAATRRLLAALDVTALDPYGGLLESAGPVAAVRALLEGADVAPLVAAVRAACARDGEFPAERRWIGRLAAAYPNDPGVLVALLLNLVELAPGQALFLPAGNLHSYLEGTGVEVMANSDNVLRGGLTSKHVDVGELLRVLDPTPGEPQVLTGHAVGGELVYETPAREFRLSRISRSVVVDTAGPQILVVTDGSAALTVRRAGGESGGLATPSGDDPAGRTMGRVGGPSGGRTARAVGSGPAAEEETVRRSRGGSGDPAAEEETVRRSRGESGDPAAEEETVRLSRGESAYVPAGSGALAISADGTAFRVTTNLAAPGVP